MPTVTNAVMTRKVNAVVTSIQSSALKSKAKSVKDFQLLVSGTKLPAGLSITDIKIPKPGQMPGGRRMVCFTVCHAVGPLDPLALGFGIKPPRLLTMVCHRVCVPIGNPLL